MGQVELHLKARVTVPLDLSTVNPQSVSAKSPAEIGRLETWRGNRRVRLQELFDISGDTDDSDPQLYISGNLTSSRRLGIGMENGLLQVEGSVGFYTGQQMKGGTITIKGDTLSWTGASLLGGLIEVHGRVGDYLGAALRGTRKGMSNGKIIVHGDAGHQVAAWMISGQLTADGNVGSFVGAHMAGGNILIKGDCEGRAGAGMTGGKIIVLGSLRDMLPSFKIDEISDRVKFGEEKWTEKFYTFQGDFVEEGLGKIQARRVSNPQFKPYEDRLG